MTEAYKEAAALKAVEFVESGMIVGLGFGSTALGVQLTNKLRLNSGEKPIPGKLNGNANKGRKTPDECQAMMDDERYRADGAAGDAFRAEVDKAFAETFGTEKV